MVMATRTVSATIASGAMVDFAIASLGSAVRTLAEILGATFCG